MPKSPLSMFWQGYFWQGFLARWTVGVSAGPARALGACHKGSFLAYQQRLDEGQGRSKGQTLFGFDKIPSANHIRARLDPASPDPFPPVFAEVVTALEGSGRLDGLRRLDGHVVIALDARNTTCRARYMVRTALSARAARTRWSILCDAVGRTQNASNGPGPSS
jgi:hypothetical protein